MKYSTLKECVPSELSLYIIRPIAYTYRIDRRTSEVAVHCMN